MLTYSNLIGAVRKSLYDYIEQEILPRYDHFDAAHRRDHVDTVINESLSLAKHYDVDSEMVFAIAAYHDTGLRYGREHHHTYSKRIVLEDARLAEWFSPEQVATMADAVEDHRASAAQPPRTVYGRIVSEADRVIEPTTIIRRTIQYTLANYPELDKTEGYIRMVQHLKEKYGRGGYLKLWIAESENSRRLEQLRELIEDESMLTKLYGRIYSEECGVKDSLKG